MSAGPLMLGHAAFHAGGAGAATITPRSGDGNLLQDELRVARKLGLLIGALEGLRFQVDATAATKIDEILKKVTDET